MTNEEILNKIWTYKKEGQVFDNIPELCAKITDAIIKMSMRRDSTDNVTVIFIAFKNFENKMKDPSFVYKGNVKCKEFKKDQFDFSLIDIKK